MIHVHSLVPFLVRHGVDVADAVRVTGLARYHGTSAIQVNGLITFEITRGLVTLSDGALSESGYDVRVQNALV